MSKTRSRSPSKAIVAFLVGSASLLAAANGSAHERRWQDHRRGPGVGAALVAGALLGAAVGLELEFHVYGGPAEPPPPPAPPPPAYSYPVYPPPAPVYQPPPVAVVQPPPPASVPVQLGLAVSGVVQSPRSGQLPLAGVAATLQARTSSQSMLSLELQSLTAYGLADDRRRNDLAGLVAGRLFFWDAALAPYFEAAGGLGRSTVTEASFDMRASRLVGRVGLGVELRLGPYLVLEGQVAQVHNLRMASGTADATSPPPAIGEHESATELRGGLAFRF